MSARTTTEILADLQIAIWKEHDQVVHLEKQLELAHMKIAELMAAQLNGTKSSRKPRRKKA